jgi:hypothetical protein
LVLRVVPATSSAHRAGAVAAPGYADVFRSPAFRRLAPAGFFSYGGLIALQSLWIGPWLTEVGGRSADDAAQGLFVVNASMLVAFLGWGLAMPRLARRGWSAVRLIALGWPPGALCMLVNVWLGPAAGPVPWAVWCVLTSVVTLSQPAVAQAFPAAVAGRALTAFNLVIFLGVFSVQWGLGLLIDALVRAGSTVPSAYRIAFLGYLAAAVLSFVAMHATKAPQGDSDNRQLP